MVQTMEPREFRDYEIQMLTEAAAQVAPVVSEARTLDRFIAPAQERLWALARNLWWSWDHDARQLIPGSRSGALEAVQPESGFAAGELPLAKLESRAGGAGPAQPHQLRLPPACRNIFTPTAPGVRDMRAFCGHVRWLISPRSLAFTNLCQCIRAVLEFWLAITLRVHRILAIPLVGIGLFYGQGYFRQRLDTAGWQQEEYLETDVAQLPLEVAIGKNGRPVTVQIETRGGPIHAKVWRVAVGRCDLFLLDSDVEGNSAEDRTLTSRLYGGGARTRIRQELLLGVGGFRALTAMGITPGVLHLNEGHSGFAVLEAIRSRMVEEGIAFDSAVPRVSREVIFTTHTPVPAGHDRFDAETDRRTFGADS